MTRDIPYGIRPPQHYRYSAGCVYLHFSPAHYQTRMRKTHWLIWTVGVGLVPIIIRFFNVVFSTGYVTGAAFNTGDWIGFALMLCVVNIVELEHENRMPATFKTSTNGLSLIQVALYVFLFSLLCRNEAHNPVEGPMPVKDALLKYSTIGLSLLTLVYSYSVFDRIKKFIPE